MVSTTSSTTKNSPPSSEPASKNKPQQTQEDDNKSAAEDAVFQALLSSQRDILSRMDFGNNSSSELQFVEGPDNLPIVSPNASAEFQLSYSSCEYEQYSEDHPYHPSHYQQHYHQQQYPHRAPRPSYQQHMPTNRHHSTHSVGVGDDRWILDQIEIGPGEVKGPEVFDVVEQPRRRKRETVEDPQEEEEEAMVEDVSQRSKKQRNGSINFLDTATYDDLLPGPSDLADLDNDASSSSLLLDDLDFPSIHSHTDAAMWRPRDRTVTEDSETLEQEAEEKPEAHKENSDDDMLMQNDVVDEVLRMEKPKKEAPTTVKLCMSMEEEGTNTARPPLPKREKRSSRSLWKPRRRSESADVSVEERRSMWKPRKMSTKREPSSLSDSCGSLTLAMEDLGLPEHTAAARVSITTVDEDEEEETEIKCTRSRPSRTVSGDSTGSVESLSAALQYSIGSTKTIQEWDKKMGLKRSHAKTMRLSSKSREQLLAFLKKEQEDLQQQQAMMEEDGTSPVPPPKAEEKKTAVVEL